MSLNELAVQGLAPGEDEVDTSKLRRRLLASALDGSLVYGHLLPFVLRRTEVSRVVVLRCEPSVLKSRLEARGYPAPKVLENVEAELIGLLLADSLKSFGSPRVLEFDTSHETPRRSARGIAEALRSARKRRPIDWTERYDSARKLVSLLGADRTDPAFT